MDNKNKSSIKEQLQPRGFKDASATGGGKRYSSGGSLSGGGTESDSSAWGGWGDEEKCEGINGGDVMDEKKICHEDSQLHVACRGNVRLFTRCRMDGLSSPGPLWEFTRLFFGCDRSQPRAAILI
jgi:hypothetical protein